MSDEDRCPKVAGCVLYPRFKSQGALRIWQERYCHHPTEHRRCERFVRSSAGAPVAADLLPNGETLPA